MGCYVNPPEMSKEDWLEENGTLCNTIPVLDLESDELPVCLVQNRLFSAAAVCCEQGKMIEFTRPDDSRKKVWYLVPIKKLLEASNLRFYIK